MDGYDDGYGTQHSYYPAYRCVLVDANGRVVSRGGEAARSAVTPQRIVFRPTSRQQQEVISPRSQVRSYKRLKNI